MTQPVPGFSAYGAVDLGAIAARSKAAAAPPSPGGQAAPGLVVDVTEATFEAEVITRSLTLPVVVDLWAEWCGPCKTLSPILERLAVADAGRWVLVKIDIDAEQRLGAAFGVQSIPAVFAVIKGQPVPLFQGALPEAEVRAYLDELLKVAAANGVSATASAAEPPGAPAPPEPVADPRYDEAYDAVDRGDYAAATAAYQALLAQSPADEQARVGLLQAELLARTEGLDPDGVLAAAAAAPDDVDSQCAAADVELLAGELDAAFDRLVQTVRRVAGDERERARAHLVTLFDLVGPDDPRVPAARRALARALY